MGIRSVALAVGLTVAWGAPQASALSLQDLADGGSLAALGGAVVFQNFAIKAKKVDLSQVDVVATAGGWSIDLDGLDKAKIELMYEAVATTPVAGASLELGGTGQAKSQSELKALNDAGKLEKVAKLKVQAGESDDQAFDPVAMLYVKSKLEVKKPPIEELTAGFVLNGLSGAAAVAPEPGTALLLLSAAAGLAASRRSRR